MLPASPQRFDGTRIDHGEAVVAVSRWRYIHMTASTLQVFILNIFPLPCVENKHRISSGGVVGSILRC